LLYYSALLNGVIAPVLIFLVTQIAGSPKTPHGDARLNFTDLFAFPKPGDATPSPISRTACDFQTPMEASRSQRCAALRVRRRREPVRTAESSLRERRFQRGLNRR
jgi:hypothetical protein